MLDARCLTHDAHTSFTMHDAWWTTNYASKMHDVHSKRNKHNQCATQKTRRWKSRMVNDLRQTHRWSNSNIVAKFDAEMSCWNEPDDKRNRRSGIARERVSSPQAWPPRRRISLAKYASTISGASQLETVVMSAEAAIIDTVLLGMQTVSTN